MLVKFVDTYGQLSDSIINRILFKADLNSNEQRSIEVNIYCANIISDFRYELLKIEFSSIVSLVFSDTERFSNFSPKDVFIKAENNHIIFDFDPIDFFDYLAENPNSNFKIRCEEMAFQVLE